MTRNNKNFIKFLLLRWKKLVPLASLQRSYQESLKTNKEVSQPFDIKFFNPLREINIVKKEIRKIDGRFKWIDGSCYIPKELSDEDVSEVYSRFQYMCIQKIKELIK